VLWFSATAQHRPAQPKSEEHDHGDGAAVTPRQRTVLGNLLLLALSVAFCLGALEGAARLARRGDRKGGKEQLERMLYAEYDPLLGWRKRPGARVLYDRRDYTVEVPINSHGLRDKERDYQCPEGASRVLALGDSFVEAYMVPFEQTVTQRLEGKLSGDRCRVEVINGGTSGYGTDQEYLFFREEGVRYSPKVVVLFAYYNDIFYNASAHNIHIPKPLLRFDGERPEVANFPVARQPPARAVADAAPEEARGSAALAWLAAHLKQSRPHAYNAIAGTGLWPPIRRQRVSPEFLVYMKKLPPEVKHAWDMTALILKALDQETSQQGGRLLVVYIPCRIEVNDSDWEVTRVRYGLKDEKWDREKVRNRLAQIAGAARIPFLDLTPALRRTARRFGGQPYFKTDNHWNAQGQEAAAEEVAGFLKGQGWVPACSGPAPR
jgi:lysophospholipase L1-like esterase